METVLIWKHGEDQFSCPRTFRRPWAKHLDMGQSNILQLHFVRFNQNWPLFIYKKLIIFEQTFNKIGYCAWSIGNSEQFSLNWGVNMAGNPVFIP